MRFTYYGHSCFEVVVSGKKLLFDPFFTGNPLATHIPVHSIVPDYILLSHGHDDHIGDTVAIAQATNAIVIAGFEVANWLEKKGVPKCLPINLGGTRKLDFGSVKSVNAIHSSQMPDGSYGGNPMGFIVENMEKSFYYSGDTALTVDMQLIPMFAKVDFAILPIGDNFTMGARDAAMAAEMAGSKIVIGVHYDTFDVIRIDKKEALNRFAEKGIKLLLPAIGESLEI